MKESRWMRNATCPACGHHVAVPFYDGGRQPLATLAWPESASQARALRRLPLDFVRCVDCGHVFNAAFRYRAVPYQAKPNRMFNRGALWAGHLETIRREMLKRLPERPVVVEIGHGDGSFLRSLAHLRPQGRYLGFDPHGAQEGGGGVQFQARLFEPERHLAELRPDLILSRHVLEHLMDPLGFVQGLAFAGAWAGLEAHLYLEVPCVDRALKAWRTEDFYYEHNSHFTTRSFRRMLGRSGLRAEEVGHGYGGEVIYAFLKLAPCRRQVGHARASRMFRDRVESARGALARQLSELASSGRRIAIWGGTGKAAAFLNAHGADAERFPLVVDSDAAKAGTYVPGAGQLIRFRDWLLDHPAEVILIPTQWRAGDIVEEILAHGIPFSQILTEHGGRLVDYFRGRHPYRRADHRERFLRSLQSLGSALNGGRPAPRPEPALAKPGRQ